MRKSVSPLSAVVLGLSLLSPACSKSSPSSSAPQVEISTDTQTNSVAVDQPPPLPPPIAAEDSTDSESGGTGTAMALDEGKMGKRDDVADAARQQAIDQARMAGILGSSSVYGTIGHGTGTGNGYGIGGGRGGMRGRDASVAVGNGGYGFGRAGFGPGGGGSIAQDPAGSSESYHDWGRNPWVDASKDHLSTFAADVDTASYTIARRKLNERALPVAAGVRVEEFVNYFRYAFPAPGSDTPFAVVMDAAPSPLSPGRHIVRVGIATKAKSESERKPAHLVFLVDVSGSMASPDKIDLAKQSLRILTNNLKDGDTVALVTYAGSSEVVLPPTGLDHKADILAAIEQLRVGGSTAMGSGIDLAYKQAMRGIAPGAVSRVIVCTDGDANVGAHTHAEILQLIAGRAKEGVTLSTIGFGMGNYKDDLMEQLADRGNGNNFYIDSLSQARRVFQQQLGSTLEVVAKDVKLQVDFDPALVARYRLVGYENRDIRDDDFRNDKVDAGEVGAGHQVTALYEVELTAAGKAAAAPLGGVRIRHKQPNGETATEAAFPMVGGAAASFETASSDFRFAFAVAAFADVLRGGPDAEHWQLAQIRELAKLSAGNDPDRLELVGLIDKAIVLKGRTAVR